MTGADLDAVEEWFVGRGLPHFVERRPSVWAVWSRAIPLLVVYYLGAAFVALDVQRYSPLRNVLTGIAAVVVVVVVWAAANIARGRPWQSIPRRVGPIELAVLIVVPLLPAAALGQWRDVVETLVVSVVVLGAIWYAASYGLVQLARWAWATTTAQLRLTANLLLRALPLLLLFTTFLFVNAEVWHVAGRLVGLPYLIVVGTFVALGAAFLSTRTPALIRRLNHFDAWAAVHAELEASDDQRRGDQGPAAPAAAQRLAAATAGDAPSDAERHLARHQRVNAALVAALPQALQITVAAAAITVFFIGFGFLAISANTAAAWTGAELNELLVVTLDGQRLSLNEPLLRVAVFLGAFTGMYFTVVLATDSTYRDEFADDVTPALRTALAVRIAYRRSVGSGTGA